MFHAILLLFLTACLLFLNLYLLLMCNIIFVCTWVGWQAHNFAEYFYDICSEYITSHMVMTYSTTDAIWVMPPWLRTLRSRAMVWSDRGDNMTDDSQEEISSPFIVYYQLYKLIKQVYHDSSHMPNYNWKIWLVIYSDSGRSSQFWSTSRLWSYLLTLVMHHGFGRWACRMSYHLSCERLRMTGLDDCIIL
jgi:hypothetical protein